MITHFVILGERCSGTNYLEQIIEKNFNITLTWDYGYKHFFGFDEHKDCDNVLFISIVRDPYEWLNSFYEKQHHLPSHMRDKDNFLSREIISYWEGSEILQDRNMHTGKRYKNIFELRKTKCEYLLDEMPKKVKNYILIKYEDLRDNPIEILERIREQFSLTPRFDEYQLIPCYTTWKGCEGTFRKKELNLLDREKITKGLDRKIEERLGYRVD